MQVFVSCIQYAVKRELKMESWVLPKIRKARQENLKFLDLGNAGITDADWPLLSELFELTELERLSFGHHYFDNEKQSYIKCPNEGRANRLQRIPQIIISLNQLRSLGLLGCKQITNEGLEHLSTLTQLNSLNLGGC
ncbi:hypothetical protein, partial [uncultured Rubinisphaera sp.]|uniref:hypothetical protein n=1 Tax=uncultured Rubinisphaera sp. TaxID=1678686 RepID=UPI0030D8D9CD